MVLCEDSECSVCYQAYCRQDRVPRVLHCRHTFCTPCLETMSQSSGDLLMVPCPLCRRVTCVPRGVGLQGALWVNIELWDSIPERTEDEVDRRVKQEEEESVTRGEAGRLSPQAECATSRPSRNKLKLPAFLKRFCLLKQHPERAVPGCNVEMRSWRRLATEDAF